jgi:PAS domain S-box-containing protein
MLERLFQKIIKPPRHSDLQTKQQLAILHFVSLGILVNNLILVLASKLLFDQIQISIISSLSIAAVMAIIQVLIRNDRLRFAKWLLVLSYLILISILIPFSGGLNSPLISGYLTSAILAGLLLGSTAGFIFAGSSLLILLIIFLFPTQFLINFPGFQLSSRAILISFSLNLMLIMAVLTSVMNSLEIVSQVNREKEIELRKSHQDLLDQIRARKTAELNLLQSEERFRSAALDSPYPMMLFAEDGEIIFINHAWSNLSGYSENELSTWEDWQKKAFRTQKKPQNKISQHIQFPEENEQIRIFTKSGQTRTWIFSSASLPDLPDTRGLVLATASDLTDLTQAEQALRESEERYSKITLATNDGIWDWDLVTNDVYYDPQYYTMSGYMVDEFPHRLEEFQNRIHPEDVDRVMQTAQDHLDNKIKQFVVEFRFQRKDSSWQWILGRGKIIEQDHHGNPLRMVGTHTDITNRKHVERELEAYRMELEQIVEDRTAKLASLIKEVEDLNKALTNLLEDFQKTNQKLSKTSALLEEANTDLESFTYSVSHDLQTPLQTIQASINKIQKAKVDADDHILLKQIQENSTYLKHQITDLQKLSRLGTQSLKIETIDMNELVANVVNEIQESTAAKANFIVDDLLPCSGDREMLRQVFFHLICNAEKFTQKHTNPKVEIGMEGDSAEVPGKITYFIRDNGVGFDMDQSEKLFNLFERLHSNQEYKGNGVGLAISKRILTRHHGKIWADSMPDEGATFFVSLNSAKS